MELGAFSVSLAVKNLQRSLEFYQKLGFTRVGGDGEHYVILQNGHTVLGLFQGMFDKNILTFNPGWDQRQQELESFESVGDIHAKLAAAGLPIIEQNVDQNPTGPAHITLEDPDGNPILIDQHLTAK